MRHLSRKQSLLCLILLEMMLVFLLVMIVIPFILFHIGDFITTLFNAMISMLEILENRYQISLFPYIETLIPILSSSKLIDHTMNIVLGVLDSFQSWLLIYVCSCYLNLKLPTFMMYVKKKYRSYYDLCQYLFDQMHDYVSSFIMLMLIQMGLYGLIFFAVGHPYWYWLALLSGFSSLIPYFGPTLVNIISILTFYKHPHLWLMVLLICLLSNIDNFFITPKIYSHHISLSGMTIFITMYLFNYFLGTSAILLAVPVLIIIKSLWIEKESIHGCFPIKRYRK